jgi:hypothetical protein
MKRAVLFMFVGVAIAAMVFAFDIKRSGARHAEELATQQSAWAQEKAELETAIEDAKSAARLIPQPTAMIPAPEPAPTVVAPAKTTPAELIARLRALKFTPNRSRAARQAIHDLEELIAAGLAALPDIRAFLARNEDMDWDSFSGGGVPEDFVLPASLRFGLFDVAKKIGGLEAEAILAAVLSSTHRGVEIAWLARALQEMAPGGYSDAALAAARQLLINPLATNSASPLDRKDRDQLFGVLAMYQDNSYVGTAQSQLVQADGALDRSALKYLQQLLGAQAVPIVAQIYNDPRLTDPAKKEPLARVALNFVGADAQANAFYNKAINDLNLPNNDRKNLIEDLNQDGFANRKNLTTQDLPLIENRLAIIEQLAPSAADPINAAAFQEAYKDLVKMREKILNPPPPKPKP